MKKILMLFLVYFILPLEGISFSQEGRPLPQEEKIRKEKIKRALDLIEGRLYFSVNWYPYYLSYKELEGEDVLDEDDGWMSNSYYVKLGYKSNAYLGDFWGSPFLEIYFRRGDGKVTYDGATWGGIPIKFKEKSKIYRWGGKFGGRKVWRKGVNIYSYIDIGKREWYRGENEIIEVNGIAVQSYKEKYWWIYFGGGTGVEFRTGENTSLGVDVELLTVPKSLRKMHAQLGSGVTFDLGGVWGVDLNFPLRFRIGKNCSFDFTPYYIFWSIDESNTKVVEIDGDYYTVYEPKSKTNVYGAFTGFTLGI